MKGTSPSAAVAPARVISYNESVVVAETASICVVMWRGSVTKAPFELQRAGLEEVVQRHPEGAGFLCVVENTAKPPDDSLRRASSEMIHSHGDRLKCVACVMEGTGFMTAVHRSALAGMVLLLRHRQTEVSVFSRVTEAGRWMSQHVDIPSLDGFPATVEHIRCRLPPVPTKR